MVNEGLSSPFAGLKGIPRAAEDIKIARDIALAESLNVPVHICHVSTHSGVRLIRDAKKAGVQVTAETCPHYFAVTDEIVTKFDTNTKVNPPIREEMDKQAILEGLKDGTLDCIITDHAPHHINDKNVEYNLAAFGICGIETSFGFAVTYLYKTGVLTLPEIAERLGVSERSVGSALEAIVEPISLFDSVYGDGEDTMYVIDKLADEDETDDAWIENISLKEAIKRLSPREMNIIERRFYKGRTQMEIADEIGISQAQVSRLEKGAIDKLRKFMM